LSLTTRITYSQSRLTRPGYFIGTGPKGKIYRLDSSGKHSELLYDSPDKNILSLVQGLTVLFTRAATAVGFIYRINTKTKDAAILYDSEQQEITALVFIGDDLYAAATSANAVGAESKFAAQQPPEGGRPEQRERRGR